jgi:hypothetical protein
MKSLIVITAVIAIALSYSFCKGSSKKPPLAHNNNGFAVVELFTSEGCSSCPPADKLVERIQSENANQPIYILAFHVDYWDFQGWKDRFANPDYSARQRRYADWLHLETVYTPQVVINGTSECVGSDEGSLTKAITAGLDQTAAATLTLQGNVEGDKLNVEYNTSNDKNADLVLALVQKSAESNVRAGENAGRKLSHVQIVRQLAYQQINDKKKITINLPKDFNQIGWELIGFVQQKNNGRITAVSRFNFQS